MWVAESSWDGAELGTCGQRSWSGQIAVAAVQFGATERSTEERVAGPVTPCQTFFPWELHSL